MIKNIIFDFGDVLLTWDPEIILRNFVKDENDIKLLTEVIYKSNEWEMLDMGSITIEKAIENMNEKLPDRLKETCSNMMYNFPKCLILNNDIVDILISLKKSGYSIYALSNTHISIYENMKSRNVGKYFDGYTISSIEHLIKPNSGIYLRLFEKFNLKPEECFFIDDKEENIKAGIQLGMPGHILNRKKYGVKKLLEDFDKYNIKI